MTDDLGFQRLLRQALDDRRAQSLLRQRRVIESSAGPIVHVDGRPYVNFSSNDYLGLRSHPVIVSASADATRAHGAGSGASALVSGYSPLHASAERALAAWKGTESSILLPSGYQANHAAVQAIAGITDASGKRVRFLVDKLVHASLIDAIRSTGLTTGRGSPGAPGLRVFPHNGIDKLQRLLDEADADELQVVVTESIFSMDGDAADLPALVALKRLRRRRDPPFVLLVDEAHGSGVYGKDGAGYAAECGVAGEVDVFIVTLSKALGSIGGAVCASAEFCDAIVNFGRAYIYSTSVPPAVPAALEAALEVMRREPDRQVRVRAISRRVRESLRAAGMMLPDGDSPIIPIILGSEDAAIMEAKRLMDLGMLVTPIRPPTVPRGSSRLRITLSSEHSDEQVDALIRALTENEMSS
ncbi:MAG: 8-amino-7-oxononanoate synthase [Tepidisphaeraceae bacterium]